MTQDERITAEEEEWRLIEGLRSNDSASLETLYEAHGSIAYGLCLRILGNPADAEDVVQESFLALWRQAERLDGARGVRSYLLTIVHNKAIDKLRSLGRKPELALDPEAPLPSLEVGPEEAVTAASERDRVRAALGDLPEEQRRAVELTYFSGLTIVQAAERLAVPVGTVKSRLRLALVRMKRGLT